MFLLDSCPQDLLHCCEFLIQAGVIVLLWSFDISIFVHPHLQNALDVGEICQQVILHLRWIEPAVYLAVIAHLIADYSVREVLFEISIENGLIREDGKTWAINISSPPLSQTKEKVLIENRPDILKEPISNLALITSISELKLLDVLFHF